VSLAAAIGLAGLLVTIYVAILMTTARRREGTANVVVANHETYPVAGAAAGWQARVDLLNRGPADASAVVAWLAPATGGQPPAWRADDPTIRAYAGGSTCCDPPVVDEPLHIWMQWRDKHGLRPHDTGIVVTGPFGTAEPPAES
jgi:hypothetical protein